MIYDITMSDKTGYATFAYTEYKDGFGNTERTPTLILAIGEYSLNFQASNSVECDG